MQSWAGVVSGGCKPPPIVDLCRTCVALHTPPLPNFSCGPAFCNTSLARGLSKQCCKPGSLQTAPVGQHYSRMTHVPGRGDDNHTYPSHCSPTIGWAHTSGLTTHLTHLLKLLRGQRRESALQFSATASLANALSDSTEAQGGLRLTYYRKHTLLITSKGSIACDWTEGKNSSATTVGHTQYTQYTQHTGDTSVVLSCGEQGHCRALHDQFL